MPRLVSRHVALPLLALPLLALSQVAACDDGGSSSGGDFTLDGGGGFETGPQPDGSVAPPDDAGTDAPVTGSGVTVTVLKGTKPVNGARVLFHDASGALTSELDTDVTGKVTSATVPNMVTVIGFEGATGGAMSLVTWVDVAAGDSMVALVPPDEDVSEPIGYYSMVYPTYAGATTYEAQATRSCVEGQAAPPGTILLPIYAYCTGATAGTILMRGNGTGTPGYTFVKGVAKPSGGATVTAPAFPSFTTGAAVTLRSTNLAGPDITGDYTLVSDGQVFYPGNPSGTVNGAGQLWPSPIGFADAVQSITLSEEFPPAGDAYILTRGFVRREAAPTAAATITHDFANALSKIATFDLVPDAAAPARPTLQWTTTGALTGHDGGAVRMIWSTPGEFTSYHRWTFVVPPGKTSVKAPVLPTLLQTVVPGANAESDIAVFFDASLITTYTQVKALPMPTSGDLELLDVYKPLPANGEVRYTGWGYLFGPPG